MEADNDNKMDVESTCIYVDEVKKEPMEVFDHVEEYIIMEAITADVYVKSDPETNDTPSDDDKTILEDLLSLATSTSTSKNTGVAEGYSDHLVDNKVLIGETYVTKDELPKEERILYCETCGAEFEGYCMKCPMISHILDNTNVATDGSSPHDTIPRDVLEFKDSTPGLGVFAVKAIPKDVTFGPFDGLESVSSTTGWAWKLRDGKPIPNKENFKSSNWMQFINCAKDIIERNLEVYQCEDHLYYRSVSEISEGEELLVHFDEEYLTSVDSDAQKYFNPVVEKSTRNIYACIFCCLGFKTETHLIKHKMVCPYGKKEDTTTEGIVQCTFCKIFLEQKELSENHVSHCRDRSASTSIHGPENSITFTYPETNGRYYVQMKIFKFADVLSAPPEKLWTKALQDMKFVVSKRAEDPVTQHTMALVSAVHHHSKTHPKVQAVKRKRFMNW